MLDLDSIIEAIHSSWSQIPPPSMNDLNSILQEWGEETWQTFVGVAPIKVNISSPEFLVCTPLLDLPSPAAAAYLGTYLLSLLDGLKFQERNGIFYDLLTRAHVLYCLSEPTFWEKVIRPYLPLKCQYVLVDFCTFISANREVLALSQEKMNLIETLSRKDLPHINLS